MDRHKNFAYSAVTTPPTGTSGTSVAVSAGQGALFPAAPFNATIWPAGVQPLSSNAEIVRVTAVVSDTFTITRAEESTTARTWTAGAQIAAMITNRTLTDVEYGAHGMINVKDPIYGAVGDGVTDDTAAIQAALDAASAAGGGKVYAPVGTYAYTRLTVAARVELCGAGQGATLLRRTALGPEGNNLRLFGVRLAGNYAALSDLSTSGIWNPADPTTQTYDFNIAVVGNDVVHTRVSNVETYHAHLGYVVGGVINDAVATYSGQSHSRVVDSYAHDTYDLGFGLVAKGTSDADTCIGCVVENCWQSNSYATAGCEVRYQRGAQVIGFNTKDNANTSLGAGVRLEETSYAQVIGLQASSCHMGVQIINDTTRCTISQVTTRRCFRGIDIRQSADIQISDVMLAQSSADGIRLFYADGTSWTKNNQNISIRGGKIYESGYLATGYGIHVVGTGYTEAALGNNGLGLVVDGVDINQTVTGHGMLVQAGGRFSILNCTFQDNAGFSADGTGIIVNPPAPNAVTDTSKPANGWIDACKFVTTGSQPFAIGAWSGTQAAKPAVGTIQIVGGATAPNYSYRSVESVGVVERGSLRAVRNVATADSPVTLVTANGLCRVNATAGACIVNLPAAATQSGGVYTIKKTDSSGNAVTITPNGAETIDGAATVVLGTQYHSRTVQSDGANWSVIGVNP